MDIFKVSFFLVPAILWVTFFGVLAMTRVLARCDARHGSETGDFRCLMHRTAASLCLLGGPFALLIVVVYELADGTTSQRRQALRYDAMAVRDSL